MSDTLHVLIIDNDPLDRSELAYYIGQYDSPCFCYQASVEVEALRILRSTPINLVFLDTNLPNDSDYKVLIEKILELASGALIILTCSAEPSLLSQFERNTVEYLIKPYQVKKTKDIIFRGLHILNNSELLDETKSNLIKLSEDNTKVVLESLIGTLPNGEKAVLQFAEVQWMEADDSSTLAHCKHYADPIRINAELSMLEGLLVTHDFFRIHERYVVNLSWVHKISHWVDGDYMMSLVGFEDTKLRMTEHYAYQLDARFDF